MVTKIFTPSSAGNGQLIFCYECPVKTKTKFKFRLYLSLLGILIGIFLLPNIAYFADITSQNLIDLTNQERVKAGQTIVTANQLLAKAAYDKAEAILAAQVFQHNINDKKFSSWVKDSGYKYSFVGENLAVDFVTAEGIVSAWLDSPTHRKNLLNPNFSEIGIATVTGNFQGSDTIIVVQIFGTTAKAVSQPRVLGVTGSNYFSSQLTSDYLLPRESENLLIHSISNQSLIPESTSKLKINYQTVKKSINIKKNFSSTLLSLLITYFIMISSIILILTICYLYFFFFSRLTKLSHH